MALLVEDDPRDCGLWPDGDPGRADIPSAQASGTSIREAIRSRAFIGLYAACLLCSVGVFLPFAHLVSYALDQGVAQSSAVLLLAMIGVGSTAGRFLLGGLADRIGRRLSLVVMIIGMALAMAIWAASTQFLALVVFALVYGVFYGGWVAVLPAIVMDQFGGRNVSGIIGVLYTSVAFGTLVGPSAAGFAFDINNSYWLPILASVCANVIAAGIVAGTLESTYRRAT